jgi:hypothetical protein
MAMSLRTTAPTFGLVVIAVTFLSSGCHRAQYRQRADCEAYALLDEKQVHARETIGKPIRIEPSAASRMFDPFDRDRPPMPEDDPGSHRYMHKVDGKRGYPMWHSAGDTNTTQNPDWVASLPLNECGVLELDADTTVRLALLHSPDYQQQLETLYLSALDVSSERFRFDTQFFGGFQSFFQADGPARTASGQSSSQLSVGPYSTGRRPWAIQRTFATGADLVVGFANSVVWEFSGPSNQSANTVLDFSLIQPLLRGAGRDRVLERLTRSERRLLANVRSLERYRRSFYLNVTVGRQIESQPQRSGGVFGVGLSGFTGLGGGFAGLNQGGNQGQNAAGVLQAGGFLGLVQDRLQIQNQEENVSRLRENLLLLEDTLVELLTTIPDDAEAIPRQRLQVAQAKQSLLTAQNQLLTQQTAHQVARDSLLRTMGLPPYICVELKDPLLTQFQLIQTELRKRLGDVSENRQFAGMINTRILDLTVAKVNQKTGLPERQLAWSDSLVKELSQLRDRLRPVLALQQVLVKQDVPQVRQDITLLRDRIPDRKRLSSRLRDVYERERDQICALLPTGGIDPAVFDDRPLDTLPENLDDDLKQIEGRLQQYGQKIHQAATEIELLIKRPPQEAAEKTPSREVFAAVRDKAVLKTQDLLTDLNDDILSLQLIQARARAEGILLPEVDMDPRTAVEIARLNRRDWLNAKAAVVDAWRLIEFNADDLESSLDLVFSGDVRNTGNNPFDLNSNTGRLRVGVQWDAPLTRLQERNTYRQSLIEFQQAKRQYYRFEDGVWQTLRGELRQAHANQIAFELQRLAIRIAAEQTSLNDDIRQLREARGLPSGPTAARDTISALNDLLTAQNNLLNIWVNYEVIRRGIDMDLGTMQLTPEGLWIDPGPIRADTVGETAAMALVAPAPGGAPIYCEPAILE